MTRNLPGPSPAAADKLKVLLSLANMAPESPTAAKLADELLRELLPDVIHMLGGMLIFSAYETLRAELAKENFSRRAPPRRASASPRPRTDDHSVTHREPSKKHQQDQAMAR
ncbi:hypothetical protein [Actinomadura luteofluorescens]|uniref:hypothetical protein n=1 Tax=Actinomadura luteofluorescens TaxID=46163 RepID=UPI0030D304A3